MDLAAGPVAAAVFTGLALLRFARRRLMASSDAAAGLLLPEALEPGDRVAVVAPSAGVAAIFPHKREQGLDRLRDVFGLVPVVFPTAKRRVNTPAQRAADLMAAFSAPGVKAIVTTIGGDDLLRVLPLLDPEVIARNPKPVLGFSDTTSLHVYLFRLHVPSLYGGSLLCQFALQGSMHPHTVESLKDALFRSAVVDLAPSRTVLHEYDDWGDVSKVDVDKPVEPHPGWKWFVPPPAAMGRSLAPAAEDVGGQGRRRGVVRGRLFGGCVDTLWSLLAVPRYLPRPEELAGCVLFLETSEEMLPANSVYALLQAMGELGLLQRFVACLVGRPKTVHLGAKPPCGEAAHVQQQQAAVVRALEEYPSPAWGGPLPAVFDMDFGHTDPQTIVPSGAWATIDTHAHTIAFDYRKRARDAGQSRL